jgi:hypothetical protein
MEVEIERTSHRTHINTWWYQIKVLQVKKPTLLAWDGSYVLERTLHKVHNVLPYKVRKHILWSKEEKIHDVLRTHELNAFSMDVSTFT